MTNYRALSLAAAALADSKRALDTAPEKFSAEFRAELHRARDLILHLRGPEQNNVPRDTNDGGTSSGSPTIAAPLNSQPSTLNA